MNQRNVLSIWIVFLLELMLLPFIIIMITDRISLYEDSIETRSVCSKSVISFNEVKGLEIKITEHSYRWKKWKVKSIVFLNNQNYELLTLPVKSTKRIHDIIFNVEKNNNKLKFSQSIIHYLNENTNYKKS